MTTYYHVTTEANWPAIQRDGLIPAIGPRSAEFGEPEAAICLFTSDEALDTGLGSWLGEMFDEDEVLVVMAVDMEGLTWSHEVEWEAMVKDTIPASRLSLLRTE